MLAEAGSRSVAMTKVHTRLCVSQTGLVVSSTTLQNTQGFLQHLLCKEQMITLLAAQQVVG